MFVGHVAIALITRPRSTRVPAAAFVAAAFVPDLIRVVFELAIRDSEMWTHAAPSIAAQAIIVASVIYVAFGESRGAWLGGLACALHFPADLFTGCKFLWIDGPRMGLLQYRYPAVDLAVELGMLALAWGVWRTRTSRRGMIGHWGWLACVAVLQVPFLAAACKSSGCSIGSTWWHWRKTEFVRMAEPPRTQPKWGCMQVAEPVSMAPAAAIGEIVGRVDTNWRRSGVC